MVKSITVRTARTMKATKMRKWATPGPRSSGSTIRFCPSPKRSRARVRVQGWSSRFCGFIASSTAVRPYIVWMKKVSPVRRSRAVTTGFIGGRST